MIAHPLVALRSAIAGEHVEPDLEPVVDALRDLERFMQRMLVRADAIDRGLRPLEGEIGVQLHHRPARCNQFGSVHLDFIVSLGEQRAAAAGQHQQASGNCQTITSS